jgi:hypothetical protein
MVKGWEALLEVVASRDPHLAVVSVAVAVVVQDHLQRCHRVKAAVEVPLDSRVGQGRLQRCRHVKVSPVAIMELAHLGHPLGHRSRKVQGPSS